MPGKKTELFQLEQFLLSHPTFSHVEIKDHNERPDFIVEQHGSSFGIEVTQLYRPASKGSFARRKVEAFREKVISRARDIYKQRKASAVDVGVMFSERSGVSTNSELLADELATFVQKVHPVDRPWVILWDDDTPTMPAAFASLRISKDECSGDGFWSMVQFGERAVLNRTLVQDAIDRKNRLVLDYRQRIPTVWLLIVIDALYLSSSFTVPQALVSEPFSYSFDRVFLFSVIEKKSWPLLSSDDK